MGRLILAVATLGCAMGMCVTGFLIDIAHVPPLAMGIASVVFALIGAMISTRGGAVR